MYILTIYYIQLYNYLYICLSTNISIYLSIYLSMQALGRSGDSTRADSSPRDREVNTFPDAGKFASFLTQDLLSCGLLRISIATYLFVLWITAHIHLY